MRIQKYLSEQGICSRRTAETWIQNGWVMVNGHVVTTLGVKIDPSKDSVTLDEKATISRQKVKRFVFYKPRGIVTHSPQEQEKSIHDVLPEQYQRYAPVGRLDKESEGLIILTNDGPFAKSCLDHHQPHRRVYRVTVNKPLSPEKIDEMEEGMMILGKRTRPCIVKMINPRVYEMTLYEGKNRQIRRMIQKVGSHVIGLCRIQFGDIYLGNMKPGEIKEISN